ncbi:hypothetical protein M378DRAFT_396896 [Amanita muscaria Koide BX008]|uniref:Uncharacterized protein n=1 Tax=Amanita muscaria (strain Koide BX008) TaxID=946122 RepID=A0A0C2WM78_AMAMK|nr:hypothetical protein M378DRAFT_396896 [Amanita muscaria Koide BX008]
MHNKFYYLYYHRHCNSILHGHNRPHSSCASTIYIFLAYLYLRTHHSQQLRWFEENLFRSLLIQHLKLA